MASTCWRFVSHLRHLPATIFAAAVDARALHLLLYLLNVYQVKVAISNTLTLAFSFAKKYFLRARSSPKKSQEEGKTFLKTCRTLFAKSENEIFLHIPHFVLLLCCWDGKRTQRRANEQSRKKKRKVIQNFISCATTNASTTTTDDEFELSVFSF